MNKNIKLLVHILYNPQTEEVLTEVNSPCITRKVGDVIRDYLREDDAWILIDEFDKYVTIKSEWKEAAL